MSEIYRPRQRGRPKAPKRLKPKGRYGDDEWYLGLIRLLPCAWDRRYTGDVQAHHCRHLVRHGLQHKVADRYCIPLSHARHTEIEAAGSKTHARLLLAAGVDARALTEELWQIYRHRPQAQHVPLMRAAIMDHQPRGPSDEWRN